MQFVMNAMFSSNSVIYCGKAKNTCKKKKVRLENLQKKLQITRQSFHKILVNKLKKWQDTVVFKEHSLSSYGQPLRH